MASFRCETDINADRQRVFDLARNIDAHTRSLAHSNERAVAGVTSGPFKRFRHVHTFETIEGGTRMIDDIDFDAPVGPIGRLVDRLILGDYLERLIQQRNQELKAEAESG